MTYNVAGLPEGANIDQFPIEHTPLISPRLNNYDLIIMVILESYRPRRTR